MKKEIKKDKIFEIVQDHWPIHIAEVMDNLEILPKTEDERQEINDLIRGHFESLSQEKKIVVEDFGQLVVAWPAEAKSLKGKKELLF
jgi:hypothetical protein